MLRESVSLRAFVALSTLIALSTLKTYEFAQEEPRQFSLPGLSLGPGIGAVIVRQIQS